MVKAMSLLRMDKSRIPDASCNAASIPSVSRISPDEETAVQQ